MAKMKSIKLFDIEILPGQETIVNIPVASLPTRTVIDIPVYIYRSKEEGPSVLLSGGLHGDEINGVEIIRTILDENYHYVKKGMIVCVPIINVFGFIHFSRYVPDGKDINRSFPGFSTGSLASKVAYNVVQHILPLIDCGIDFHTGGAQRTNYPQIRADFTDEKNLQMANAFHAPFSIHKDLIQQSFREAAYDLGKNIIVYEGGESLRFCKNAIQQGVHGTLRFLESLDMVDHAPKPLKENHLIQNTSWLRAPAAGMWVSSIIEGDFIEKNTPMGYITSPYGDFKEPVVADHTGYIIGLNNQPVVNKGDALVNFGFN